MRGCRALQPESQPLRTTRSAGRAVGVGGRTARPRIAARPAITFRRTSNITALRSDPVLSSDSRHAAELAHIIGYDDQPLAAGMTANLHIMRAAGSSSALQFRPNLSVMRSSFGLERQDIEARHKMLNG